MAVRFDKVQTTLAKYATQRLSKDLNTTIHIGKLNITPVSKIELLDFYVLDLEKDTVIRTDKLSILAKNINLEKNRIIIDKISLEDADIQLIKREGQRGFSFQFILDYFDGDSEKSKNSEDFFISTNKIELKNSRFRFKDYRAKATYYGMDFTDLDAQPINLTFSDFKNIGSNIKVKIDHLSSIEKSGFNLKNLTGQVELDSNFVHIDSLRILTPDSEIVTDYFRFEFDDPNFFEDDFENKVTMKTNFRKTKLNLSDIGFFTSFFEGIDREVVLSGKFDGTVADFKTTNLRLKIDNNSEFYGNLAMKGLPYTDNTTFDVLIKKFETTENEINNIDIPPFTKNNKLKLPEELAGIGNIDITGKMKGKFDDFLSDLKIQTSEGNVNLDTRYWEEGTNTNLKGKVIAENLNIGKFAKNDDLKTLDANLLTDLQWNNKTGLSLKTKGELPQFSYKGYSYKNIKLDGTFTDNSYIGEASIKDKNGNVDFTGNIDFSKEVPLFDFESKVKNLNLTRLKIINDTNIHIISGDVSIKGSGNELDNSTGIGKITNLVYKQNNKTYTNKEITIKSEIVDSLRKLSLLSDIANANINGKFQISELPKIADLIGQQVVPALYSSIDTIKVENQSFKFDVLVKDFTPIKDLFVPSLSIAENTKASGDFNSLNEKFNLQVISDSVVFQDYEFNSIIANLNKPKDILDLNITLDNFKTGNSFILETVTISSLIKRDHIMPSIKWKSTDGESYGKIQGDGYWYSEDYFDLLVLPSYFHFKDRDWVITENASLIVDSTNFNFNGIEIINNFNEGLTLVGDISEDSNDVLKVYLDNFNLTYLNPFIGNENTKYYGNINGSACIKNVYKQIEIVSDFYIDSLQVNNEIVGDLVVNTDWINEKKGMHLKGELLKNSFNTFDFIGYYYPFKDKNSIDFKCLLKNTDLAFLNPYVVGQGISGINGNARGEVKVTGEPQSPLLEGEISLVRTGFNVNYLNTHYDFSGLMIVENNDIYTDNIIEIRDEENNLAYFNGAIYHENFRDFDFNVFLEIPENVYVKGDKKELRKFEDSRKSKNKFIGLNTNIDLNDDFYGKIYATGDVNVEGYQDEIDIVVNAKTEKGSNFTLPLYGSSEVKLEDYVIFVNPDTTIDEKETVSLEGINLDMNIEVTPDAKMQLVFDEVYGDIISGTGSGKLNLTVDKQEQFSLSGEYVIDKGDYLFTLGLERFENLINKKFDIANGSTINWYGDPYNAEIDINAIYKLKASLYEIMPQLTENSDKYKSRTDVECHMNLTNNLMSPDINFSIQLPRANETERAVIANLVQTKQELNKQVFSLLLLNRFLPSTNSISEEGRGGSGAVSTTASELLSNQLSNWLSKLSNNIDVGLNYRPGDDITSDEIAVALSTELFNDRLVISSNFGVAQGNEINQNENELIGDVNVEYKLNEDGSFRVRVFTRTNEYDITNTNQSQTTSGVGVYYKKEFNNWKEFITPKRRRNR